MGARSHNNTNTNMSSKTLDAGSTGEFIVLIWFHTTGVSNPSDAMVISLIVTYPYHIQKKFANDHIENAVKSSRSSPEVSVQVKRRSEVR